MIKSEAVVEDICVELCCAEEGDVQNGPFFLCSYRQLPPREGTRQRRATEVSFHDLKATTLEEAQEALDHVAEGLIHHELRRMMGEEAYVRFLELFLAGLNDPTFTAAIHSCCVKCDWASLTPRLKAMLNTAHEVDNAGN